MLGFSLFSLPPQSRSLEKEVGEEQTRQRGWQGDYHGLSIPAQPVGLLGSPEVRLSPHQVTVSREAEEEHSPAS